jgi:hypothetical protein
MNSRIEMVKEEPSGTIVMEAIYEKDSEYPGLVVVKDGRSSESRTEKRFKMVYSKSTHSLGVKDTRSSEDPDSSSDDSEEILDSEIMDMIDQLYDDDIDVYDYYSYDSFRRSVQRFGRKIVVSIKEITDTISDLR